MDDSSSEENIKAVDLFKSVVGKFPTGVTVISTKSDDHLYGFTANSFTSVSLDPYLVSFCLNIKSGCVQGFKKAKYFAISILAYDQADISNNFASHNQNKFKDIRYTPSKFSDSPIINGCLGYIECSVKQIIECGDHYIFIGEAVDFVLSDNKKPPLIYFAKSYTSLKL